MRSAWISAFNENRIDERLALRILQERIHDYIVYETEVEEKRLRAEKIRQKGKRGGYFQKKQAPEDDTRQPSNSSSDDSDISEAESGVKGAFLREDSHD